MYNHNPQIITNISSDTKVLGACVSTYNGRSATDVGGTSYCSTSNTIYIVQNQIAPLYKYFGPAAVAYIIAHEYGHYVQSVFGIPYVRIVSELQADCLSGAAAQASAAAAAACSSAGGGLPRGALSCGVLHSVDKNFATRILPIRLSQLLYMYGSSTVVLVLRTVH